MSDLLATSDSSALADQPDQSANSPRIRKSLVAGFVVAIIAGLLWTFRAPIRQYCSIRTAEEIELEQFLNGLRERMMRDRSESQSGKVRNQIDFSNLTIDESEIFASARKDSIPSLTDPKYVKLDEEQRMQPDDRLIGVVRNDDVRAYPLRILDEHEVVNDNLGGTPIAVTYCPLCDSAMVFERRIDGEELEFGVSGFLYKSNVLLYDRQKDGAESLWSQMTGTAVSGPRAKKSMKVLPCELTTLEDWNSRHPDSGVLSFETGYKRNYTGWNYAEVPITEDLLVPVQPQSKRFKNKMRLIGVWSGEIFRAYPVTEFESLTEPIEISDKIDGKTLTLQYVPKTRSLKVVHADDGLEWMYAYWFAWYAFHPKMEVYQREAN